MLGWILAIGMFGLVRTYGAVVMAPAEISPHNILRMMFIFGPLAGLLFGAAEIKVERYYYRRIPLKKLVLLGLTVNVYVMAILYVFVFFFIKTVIGFSQPTTFWQFLSNPNTILIFFYSVLVNFVLASLRQLNLLLGPGNLWRLARGDFYSPRVENRIFMFIDLKGSTGIAEKLGHIKYSQFLQDCFYDLRVAQNYHAEVYQYVGDEVVLSWKVKANLDFFSAIKTFWAFEDELVKRNEYYKTQYGVIPVFKAGVNEGEVTAAEVGEIKREIAYHGDTMNIASRIQEQCNKYGRSLLVSECFLDKVKNNGLCKVERIGEEQLRGKQTTIGIYAVERL